MLFLKVFLKKKEYFMSNSGYIRSLIKRCEEVSIFLPEWVLLKAIFWDLEGLELQRRPSIQKLIFSSCFYLSFLDLLHRRCS